MPLPVYLHPHISKLLLPKLFFFALYESEDIDLAMCYYRLADLDWYGLYAEELITEIALDKSVRNKKMELHEEIALYKQIAEGTANELDLSKMEVTGIVSLYLKILLMEEKGAASEDLVRRSKLFTSPSSKSSIFSTAWLVIKPSWQIMIGSLTSLCSEIRKACTILS